MASYSKYSRQPGDSILALLEPGEYVLNRNAVNEIGKENLDELNFEEAPRFNMAQRMEMQLGGMLGESLGMQSGGSMEYGGVTTEIPTFQDLYNKLNIQPNFIQKPKFEEEFEYDPAREGIHFEDYSRSVSDSTKTGQQKLLSQGQELKQQEAKSGFAGAGAPQAVADTARSSIMDDFMSAQKAAQSSLFKGVQNERDTWMREAGAGLKALQQAEGTMTAGGSGFQGTDLEVVDSLPASGSMGDTVIYNNNIHIWIAGLGWRDTGQSPGQT